jgi:hypothetical protein
MGHLFVAAPIRPEARSSLEALLASMTLAPGQADPWNPIVPFGRIEALHFARVLILDDPSLPDRERHTDLPLQEPVRLALIADGDGTTDTLLGALVHAAAPGLQQIFGHCADFSADDLRRWLADRRIGPAALYLNRPRLTARQMREEAELHSALLAARRAHPQLSSAELAPVLREAGARVPLSPLPRATLGERVAGIGHFLLLPLTALLLAPLLIPALPVLAWMLRRRERSDPVIAPRPSRERNRVLSRIEDHDLTNQYSAIGTVKPGRFRKYLTIAILWAINWGARHLYARGRLARVNTIHAASWTFLDDRRRVFFASNYDGSREAYNDDFINKVAFGLNLSFSNGLGYPRTDWLVIGGARHEQDFKRYLFHHQIPTQVWYKAVPALTTYDVARNARIRRGFEGDLRGAALRRWIAEI